MTVNTTDRQLRENLEFIKGCNFPKLELQEPHDRTLAIVGSGPSLKDNWALIPKDCDVMALNGAYGFLLEQGRRAEYFAMLDARPQNVNFLRRCDSFTHFLLASQCHQDAFNAVLGTFARFTSADGGIPGPSVGVFHLNTPSTHAVFKDESLYVGGGGTIGLTAMILAYVLGYRKVILYGFDSSYEGGASHVAPQAQNAGQKTLDVWIEDRKYTTSHAMAQQVMDFFPILNGIRELAPEFDVQVIGRGLFYDYVVTNNKPATRESELTKYVEAYKHADYGMTQERRDGLDELIGQLSGVSYLDISTGRGEVLELADKHGFKRVCGTETVPDLCKGRVTQDILPNIPHPDHSFDCVSLIEVIEHLLPDDVRPALDELTRLARRHILISAATQPHWYGGVNLHPSARPEEEWQALFTEVWGDKVQRVRNLGLSPCWRVNL